MRKSLLMGFLFLLLSIFSNQLKSQNANFEDFQALSENLFFLQTETKPIFGAFYNLEEDAVIRDVVKSGRGPFEIENIGAFTYDASSNLLFIGDKTNGRFIAFNLNGEPILENTLKIPYLINLDAYKGKLIATQGILLRDSKNLSRYPLGFILNQSNLEVTDSLFFDLRKLNLDKIKNSFRVKIFSIRPQIIALENDLYLVSFQSISTIFLIDKKSNILSSVFIEVPNFEGMKVVEHPSYGYGQTMYSVFNDFVRIENGIYLSFGHKSKDIPAGVVSIEFNDGNELKTNTFLIEDENNVTNEFIITTDGSKIYGTDGSRIFPLKFK